MVPISHKVQHFEILKDVHDAVQCYSQLPVVWDRLFPHLTAGGAEAQRKKLACPKVLGLV